LKRRSDPPPIVEDDWSSDERRLYSMATTITPSLVQRYAAMDPREFGESVQPRWQVAERLVNEVRTVVESKHLTPLDGARLISSITATLFGYDEFILREFSPEALLASSSMEERGKR
jgi:hypothetical protein